MTRSAYGHIRKQPSGHYRCEWTEHGQKRSKVVPTHKEATALIAQMRILNGQVDHSITYNEYVKAAMVPTWSKLAERTKYDRVYRYSRLEPYIGETKIANTNWRLVEKVINEFQSATVQKDIFALWRNILNYAVRDGIIMSNPCDRNIKRKKIIPKEKVIYTREQLLQILRQIKNTEFALPVLIECCCGLRHEEYCALNHRDFDFQDDGWVFISVSKALTNVKSKKILKDTKNASSARIVALDGRLEEYLLCNSIFMKNKRTLAEYTNPNVIRNRWKKYCKRNDIVYTPFGTMRSIYATLCSEAGCIDSVVSMALGHSSSAAKSVKLRHYQTPTMKALKLNAECFADYLLDGEEEL